MLVQAFAFYFFSAVLLISALMVVTARNPVHSVLFLILSFFTSAGLFVMLGAEFIGMILVIVYVGAVAVLFLFVVMMLDVDFKNLRQGTMQYLPVGLLIAGVLIFELVTLSMYWSFSERASVLAETPVVTDISNAHQIGMVLYTDYVFPFQMAGLILFVAMIGAIVLTLRQRPDVKKQIVSKQHARKPSDVLEVVDVTTGTGV